MKTFYFNIQAKGGTGKSMLTYLQALKNEQNEKVLFVDVDQSTKTSVQQLKFLKDRDRVFEVDITDSLNRIEREKLSQVLEGLGEMEFQEYYMDFGAPESEQLPSLFTMDYSIDEFKEVEQAAGGKFVFNIVIAGGTSYLSCMEYAAKVSKALQGQFEVWLYVNEFSFQSYQDLITEVNQYVEASAGRINGIKAFGNLYIDRMSGQKILSFARDGRGLSEYSGIATKIILRRELAKV